MAPAGLAARRAERALRLAEAAVRAGDDGSVKQHLVEHREAVDLATGYGDDAAALEEAIAGMKGAAPAGTGSDG